MDKVSEALAELVRAKQHEADCRNAWFAAKDAADTAQALVGKAAWSTQQAVYAFDKVVNEAVKMVQPEDWQRW